MYKSIFGLTPFTYVAAADVAANGTLPVTINFANDSDFILVELRQLAQTAGNISTQLSLQNGEQFSSDPLDASIEGSGFNGIRFFPVQLMPAGDNRSRLMYTRIPANTQLQVAITNASAGELYHEVHLWGYKIDCNSIVG